MGQDASNVASRWIVSKDKVPYGRWVLKRCTHLNLDFWLLIGTTSAAYSMLRHQSRRTTSPRTSPISPLAALRKLCLQLLPRGSLLLRQLTHHGNGEERGGVNLSKPSVKGFRYFIYCTCFLDDWNPSLENNIIYIRSISSQVGLPRLKTEDAESLMSSNFLLESVDRRISSNLLKTYRTYNDLSLGTSEDPPSMVRPLSMYLDILDRQDANKDIRHVTWQSNCWVRFGGIPLKR